MGRMLLIKELKSTRNSKKKQLNYTYQIDESLKKYPRTEEGSKIHSYYYFLWDAS